MKLRIFKIMMMTLCLMSMNVIQSTAQCNGASSLNLSTGISTSGTNLPTTGVIDPYWELTNLPPLATSTMSGFSVPTVYTIPTGSAGLGLGFPNWCNIPGTVGLSVVPTPYFSDNNLNMNQPWRFIRKFSVTSAGNILFSGSFIGDDIADLRVFSNSGVQYFHESGIGHSVVKPFSDTLQLPAGCYFLEVTVANAGAYAMGFALNGIMTTTSNILANPSSSCCSGSIVSGQKWIDKDCNQKLTSLDVPAAGWTFNLLSGSTIIQTTTTNSLGEFYFNNVPNGSYTVAEVSQPGYTASFPSTGSYSINLSSVDSVVSLIFLNCQDSIPPSNCAQIIDPVIQCEKGQYTMSFSVKNLTSWDMKGLTIRNLNPTVTASSTMSNGGQPFFNIPDIYAGATSGIITIPIYVPIYSPTACFDFTFCTADAPNIPTLNCCTIDSICMNVEECKQGPPDPCDTLTSIDYKPSDTTGNCCFNLSLNNNYTLANLQSISMTGIGGTEFVVTTTSGWAYSSTSTATYRELQAPPGGIGVGTYPDFLKLCITSTNPAPHKIVVDYKDINGVYLCTDTIEFEHCNVVAPNCATIMDDSIYCENGKTILKFNIVNHASFPIRQLDYFINDTSHFKLTPSLIQFTPTNAIAVGATAGPFTVEVDTINGGASQFCFQVSAHDSAYTSTSYASTCCSDAIRQVCLPFIHCEHDGCCDFDDMQIPNGITPNGDGMNDVLHIVKPSNCDSISITIFNRWGNIVYKDKNYTNNWGGTNQNGSLLPQSTYFIVIELKNGSKKGMYVDVRY